jgi:hypothetical protein
MIVTRHRHGPCRALAWHAEQGRYVCGLLAAAEASARAGWRARLMRRWIGAGIGCDSSATIERH